MMSVQQIRRFFFTMGLAALLATVTAFSFQSNDSWATTSLNQLIGQPPSQVVSLNPAEAIFKNIQGKAQDVLDSVKGESQAETGESSTEVEATTRDAINQSIDNPNYQPAGQTKQAQEQKRAASQGIESQVDADYDQTKP